MITFSNAKINLGLYVTGRREDGYHNIESLFLPIALCDAVELIPSTENEIRLFGNKIPGNLSENSCLKALQLMQERYTVQSYQINLFKRIPAGGGLGGGSSNASFVIRLINQLERLNLSNLEMEELALQIGSDNPFFIENTPKYVTGRGEIMQACPLDLKGYQLALIFPNVHMSTSKAYQLVEHGKPLFQLNELTVENFFEKQNQLHNAFQEPFLQLFPATKEIIHQMKKADTLYTSLTGSGSTFYAIYQPNQTIPNRLKEFAIKQNYQYFETTFL